MTNLAHYRYLILAAISFLLAVSANSPVLAGTNIAGLGNLALGQSSYYENTSPPSEVAYLFGGLLATVILATVIYMVFFMNKSDKKGS